MVDRLQIERRVVFPSSIRRQVGRFHLRRLLDPFPYSDVCGATRPPDGLAVLPMRLRNLEGRCEEGQLRALLRPFEVVLVREVFQSEYNADVGRQFDAVRERSRKLDLGLIRSS